MAQFDVYLNPNADTCKVIPYLLDVQADLLDALSTRVVAPLALAEEMGLTAKRLNPHFKIKGEAVVMSTAELAGVSSHLLGDKVASLKNKRDEIIAALDLLLTGI
ncbi:MAG: CcdB family protein [Gallionella sp.]|nr:CcdB family protein [Gallionella sp.]